MHTLGMRLAMQRLSLLLRRPSMGLQIRARRGGGLLGREAARTVDGARVGFFVGFLTNAGPWADLGVTPPEAVVFAFVDPVGSRLHERLVGRRGSLFERVATEARRSGVPFEFRRDRFAALARHRSLRGRPPEILALTARDVFTTSLRGLWAGDFFERLGTIRPAGSRARG